QVVRWNRYERRGEQYGEFAKVDNPAIGSTLYYYLKGEPKAVQLIKDLEGTLIQELAGNAKKGLQKASWNLTKRADPAPQGAGPGGGGMRRGGRINLVDSGVYKVTLNVDGKDIATKTIKVSPDPNFK
ncbi:MAG: VPS10 domain-containing protein, partial [Candidatus Aminicenantales bacterium]